jgi:hypothetical protein
MDCSAVVFVDDYSNFFNIFCHFAGTWLPWTFVIFKWHSTDLEMWMPFNLWMSNLRIISRVSVAIYWASHKTCSILPSIADKTKHKVQKTPRLMEVWSWPPLSSTFTEAVKTVTVRELSYTTAYILMYHHPWGVLFIYSPTSLYVVTSLLSLSFTTDPAVGWPLE